MKKYYNFFQSQVNKYNIIRRAISFRFRLLK